MKIYRFHRSSFRKWLESMNPDDVVGVRCHSLECPVANWIYDHRGFEARVGDRHITVDSGTIRSPWIKRFVRLVDTGAESFQPVTAGEALSYLDQIDRELVAQG